MIKRNCIICNKQFMIKPYRKDTAKYCSYKCMHIARKGAKHTEETIEKMRKHIPWNKGKKLHYQVWSKGRKFSLEHRKKLSLAKIGCVPWIKGHKHSKEARRKMSISRTGKILTKEHCENMRKANLGEKSSCWKGGKYIHHGYIYITKHSHPFCMKGGRVLEHRLIMEKHLGRYLTPEEVVHHRGIKYSPGSIKNRSDNRIENLKLFKNDSEHKIFEHRIGTYL